MIARPAPKHQIEERQVVSLLEVLDLTSLERTVVKEFDELIEAPNWKLNGRELVYNAHGHLFDFDLETRTTKKINLDFCDHCNNDHVLSPDNSMVAVSHHSFEDGLSRIYTAPLGGGKPRLITALGPSYLHGWSPDGSQLAYCALRNGDYDIFAIDAQGGVETQLTDSPGLNDGPEYDPSGKYIWFNSVRTGLMQIWRMKRDGSEQTQMTFDEANSWFPHISPDGKWVAYIAYHKGDVEPGSHPANKNVEIRLMPASGGPHRCIATLFGGQGSLNVNSWSPDSKGLTFVSYRLKA